MLGALEWTEEKIRDAVKQLLNHKLAFIKEARNIELVKDSQKSSEFSILKQWIPKGEYHILVNLGLALRKIADDQERVKDLVTKISRKYDARGLHIAEITEVGITHQLLTHLTEIYAEPEEVSRRLGFFFERVEDLVIWVKSSSNAKTLVKLICTRIEAIEAHIIILFGRGYANTVVESILKELSKDSRGYIIDSRKEGIQMTVFIFTPEMRAQITHWSDSFSV